jgi:hypothetical protein
MRMAGEYLSCFEKTDSWREAPAQSNGYDDAGWNRGG